MFLKTNRTQRTFANGGVREHPRRQRRSTQTNRTQTNTNEREHYPVREHVYCTCFAFSPWRTSILLRYCICGADASKLQGSARLASTRQRSLLATIPASRRPASVISIEKQSDPVPRRRCAGTCKMRRRAGKWQRRHAAEDVPARAIFVHWGLPMGQLPSEVGARTAFGPSGHFAVTKLEHPGWNVSGTPDWLQDLPRSAP